MKHLLVIAAFVAACCADLGERGYKYVPPSKPVPHGGSAAYHGGRPSRRGDEIPHGGHGTDMPQGGHGSGFPQRPQSDHTSTGSQRPRPQAPQQDVRQTSPGGEFNQGVSQLQRPFGSDGSWVGGQGRFGVPAFISGQNDDPSTPTSSGGSSPDDGNSEGGEISGIPGLPGVDYPNYDTFPQTSFSCANQQFPGYYADVETKCQGYHSCHDGYQFDFLCPNGTIFHQEHFVCGWWNQFDCSTAPDLFHLNENFYVTPSTPPEPSSRADYAVQLGSGYPSGGQRQRPFGGQQQQYPNHNRPSLQADVPHGGYIPTY